MQSKRMSAIETITDIGLGWIVAIVIYMFVLDLSFQAAMKANMLFLLVSIIRRYVVRRVFSNLEF